MALRNASAYALRTRPLGEADLIVEFYTLELGRVRAVAKAARRIRSRFGSAFEPMTRSHLVFFRRDKDDLGRVSTCDIEKSYFEVLADLEPGAFAAYVSELLMGFTVEVDPTPAIYRLVGVVLDAVEEGVDLSLSARYFETWLLRLSGLYPDLATCGECGRALGSRAWISMTTLELIGSSCRAGSIEREHAASRAGAQQRRGRGNGAGARLVRPQTLELVGRVTRARPTEVAAAGVSSGAVEGLGELNRVLIAGHLDRIPRSLSYIDQLRKLGKIRRPAGVEKAKPRRQIGSAV